MPSTTVGGGGSFGFAPMLVAAASAERAVLPPIASRRAPDRSRARHAWRIADQSRRRGRRALRRLRQAWRGRRKLGKAFDEEALRAWHVGRRGGIAHAENDMPALQSRIRRARQASADRALAQAGDGAHEAERQDRSRVIFPAERPRHERSNRPEAVSSAYSRCWRHRRFRGLLILDPDAAPG